MTALAGPLYVIVGVLILAGVAKAFRPAPTAIALRVLKVPRPVHAARLLGVGEILIGAIAVITGSPIAWGLVAVLYAGFTVFVLWAISGSSALLSCGCFGQADTPATPGHAAFNATAGALAVLGSLDAARITDFDGTVTQAVLFGLLIAIGVALSILALTELPRILALANGKAGPSVAEFALAEAESRR